MIILRHLNSYGFCFTVPFAVKTGNAVIRVNHYRRLVKPFEDPIPTGLDTHPAALATIVIDLYTNMHIKQSILT
jgi:hypothetical protein